MPVSIGKGGPMARISVHQYKIDAGFGSVVITLQSLRAHPMQGVMSTLGQQIIAPEPPTDPTLVTWRLPAEDQRYVLYGIVTPLNRLMLGPTYERRVTQGGELLKGRKNPARISARKSNAGEYVGTPELISIKIK